MSALGRRSFLLLRIDLDFNCTFLFYLRTVDVIVILVHWLNSGNISLLETVLSRHELLQADLAG